jgi:hypothetical protein
MKRKAVVRHVTLGALATGLLPLTAAGVGAEPADSAAALCRSTFGDGGPTEGRIVGEGPSGDSMEVGIGWNPSDWPGDQIGRIVTCVSVDGKAVPHLATSTVGPPNTGSLTLDLTLPAGEPGSVVCEQSVLVGKDDAPGRTPPTGPVCFKLRASDPPPPTRAGGSTFAGPEAPRPAGPAAPVSPVPPAAPAPSAQAGPPAPSRPAVPPASKPSRPDPASTPPARAAFEAAASAVRTPPVRITAPAAAAPTASPAATAAPAPAVPPAAGAPGTALARTGIENQIPLAGAGVLLAFGGAAILFGQPGRRSWSSNPV